MRIRPLNQVDYESILEVISTSRINSYLILLPSNPSDQEKYAAYAWARDVSASIYPLMHALEITLRNSIDKEARRRFGDFWWDKKGLNIDKSNSSNFNAGIDKAKRTLSSAWKSRERKRLGLSPSDPLPATSKQPVFSHDDIVAATNFSVWKDVLTDAHSTSDNNLRSEYLWPQSMGKVFKRYNLFSSSPHDARSEIINTLEMLRVFRNRLFHHDCIWSKHDAHDRRSAIDSIRHRVNLIEKLIESTSPSTHQALRSWGEIDKAKDICSEETLSKYLSRFD